MIYITGDTHIPVDIGKLSAKKFPEQKKMTKKDHVIICGDFGGVWDNSNEERYWLSWLEDKNFTTLFVDGNHENFDMLREFEVVDFCEGKAHKISNSIYHLMRGNVYDIDSKRIFTFGGASSHDKERRKEGKSWWKAELPSKSELERALKRLGTVGWRVDYVITHCASGAVQRKLSKNYGEDRLTAFFDKLDGRLEYKHWFFGHYHVDKKVDEKHTAVFNKIYQI